MQEHVLLILQLANVAKDLGVLVDNSFLPSIHFKEAASKARRMLHMMRRAFAELSVSAFASFYNTLVRPILSTLGRRALQTLLPTVWSKYSGWGRGSVRVSADCHVRQDYIGWVTFLTQASPPWRPHSRTQNVFRRIGSGPQPLFYCASAA